jgi:hypothetical protein
MLNKLLTAILFSALLSISLLAQDEPPADAENCQDSPIITRVPGSTIHSCDNKEFEQVKVPVAKDAKIT